MTSSAFLKYLLAGSLLSLLAVQCLCSAWTTGQTTDETYYNGTGYPIVRYNDYRMIGEHPPLTMILASLPLLFLKVHFPIDRPVYLDAAKKEIDISKTGSLFLYGMGNNPQIILFYERAMIVILTLLLGAFLFSWGCDLYGLSGGALALILFVFSPDIIAHGSLFTSDMGLTTFCFLTLYFIRRYFGHYNLKNALISGILCGLALLTKISSLILFPLILSLFIFFSYLPKKQQETNSLAVSILGALASLLFIFIFTNKLMLAVAGPFCLIAFLIVARESLAKNAKLLTISECVIFVGWVLCVICVFLLKKQSLPLRSLFLFWNFSCLLFAIYYLRTKQNSTFINATKSFLLIWMTAIAVMALGYTDFYKTIMRLNPYAHYLKSFSIAFSHSMGGHAICIADSVVSCDWKYFLTALSVKIPLATIVLFSLGFISLFKLKINKIDKALIVLPLLLYLLAASLLNKINIGVRHILPIYPFLFLAAGAIMPVIMSFKSKFVQMMSKSLILIILSLMIVRHMSFAPDYISYANEFLGAPEKAAATLADSNFNWGQDNQRLVNYCRIENISSIKIASPAINPDAYDFYHLSWSPMQDKDFADPAPGFYALDISTYLTFQKTLSKSWFKRRAPHAHVGRTFYVFKVD